VLVGREDLAVQNPVGEFVEEHETSFVVVDVVSPNLGRVFLQPRLYRWVQLRPCEQHRKALLKLGVREAFVVVEAAVGLAAAIALESLRPDLQRGKQLPQLQVVLEVDEEEPELVPVDVVGREASDRRNNVARRVE